MFYVFTGVATALSPIELVHDSKPSAVVVMPAEPHRFEKIAAQDLVAVIQKMSGARLAVLTLGKDDIPAGKVRILIGGAAIRTVPRLGVERSLDKRNDLMSCRDGYAIRARGDTIALAGMRPAGTLFAVSDLLHRLGCRWFFAGDLGEVIPQSRTIGIKPFEVVQTPSFDMRILSFSAAHGDDAQNLDKLEDLTAWLRRNRLSLDYDTALQSLMPRVELDNPDHVLGIAKIADARLEAGESPLNLQVRGYGSVDEDQSLGLRDPWFGIRQISEPLYRFYTQVVDKVHHEHPDRLYGVVVSLDQVVAPQTFRPHRGIIPALSVEPPCALHAPGVGRCWRRDVMLDAIANWSAVSDNVIIYDSATGFDSGACVPLPLVTRMRSEYPAWHEAGLRGRYAYIKMSAMNNGPDLYVHANLLWNVHADVDELLDDYFTKLFGPAAKPARAYWDALQRMWDTALGHGKSQQMLSSIYPIDKVRPLEKLVIDVEQRAHGGLLHRRARMLRYSYENLLLYLRMREAEDEARFGEAAQLAWRLWRLHEEIEDFDPYIYKIGDLFRNGEDRPNCSIGWSRRNRARHDLTDGTKGDLVAVLPDEWLFRADPHGEGFVGRWFEPQADARPWQPIRTTRFWQVQHAGAKWSDDKSVAVWYRTQIDVPARFAGRTIRVDFSDVAGQMMLWVNGRLNGAIEPGKTNTVVARVVGRSSRPSGIFQRVVLWSPVEP